MLYHASPTPDIKTLVPHVSNHGKPLIYLSSKRENVLVYLSNAVEKCCREKGFKHQGAYRKWASYGFTKEGVLQLDEYWQGATSDTYKGVSGYIYTLSETASCLPMQDIPFAFTSDSPIPVLSREFIPDAYEALLSAAKEGKLLLTSYGQNSPEKLDWIKTAVTKEYEESHDSPEYRFFLKTKFSFLS